MFIEPKKVVANLLASQGASGQRASVKLGIDRSVSIQDLYDNGTMQKVIERVIPASLVLDDDGKLGMYSFADTVTRLSQFATESNYAGFVNNYMSNIDYGGTKYAPMIQAIMSDCGVDRQKQITYMKHTKKLFGFGKDTQVEQKDYIHVGPTGYNMMPTIAIIITDGDAEDKLDAERLIVDAAKYPIFFQFVGVKGNPSPDFKFLKSIDTLKGRFIDNVGFTEVTASDLASKTDEQFYKMLLTEFTQSWLPTAKKQFLIK